jgi:hypothetical protein
MMQLWMAGLAAAIGLALASAPTQADVLFTFAQTGGTLAVTDAAYAQGLDLSSLAATSAAPPPGCCALTSVSRPWAPAPA